VFSIHYRKYYMKYYESTYEDYISTLLKHNLHDELTSVHNSFPSKLCQLENLIIHGPSGIGKYSQVLYLLKKYSPSDMKYEKKMVANTDKQEYIYKISDIHYEIDMSLWVVIQKCYGMKCFCK